MVYPYQLVATFGISFLLGVLLASYFYLPLYIILVGIFLFGAILFFQPKSLIKIIAVFALGLLLGWWRYDSAIQPVENSVANWADETLLVTGIIKSDPEVVDNRQTFRLSVSLIDNEPATGKILISTWPLPRFVYGDEINVETKISVPTVTPEFDYAAYLRKDGIYALGQTVGNITVVSSPRNSILYWLY